MDYSKLYHDWLQLDLAQEEEPNFYQILGLKNMESDVQKIQAAIQSTLNRLQEVNGTSQPDAYTAILSRVLEARKVLLNPNQKYTYDLRLAQITGETIQKGYERPTIAVRIRQMSLITFSFILGLGVMTMMALSVERNPDGSIIFHEEAKVRKVPPFTAQLQYVVYRPSIAQDYQSEGYAAVVESSEVAVPTVETPENPHSEATADSEKQNTELEMEEFSQILSEENVESAHEDGQKVNRRSPLYKKSGVNEESPTTEKEQGEPDSEIEVNIDPDASPKEFPVDLPEGQTETGVEVPVKTGEGEPIAVISEAPRVGISLTSVMELLENVRANMDLSKPGAADAYTLLQYQTVTEILQKLKDAKGNVDSEEARKFAEYALNVVTDLGWEKHFEEAFQLCETLKAFGKEFQMVEALEETVNQRYKAVANYQMLYHDSQKVLAELKEKPDDPLLNTQYAMWLWQENGNLKDSISYLTKCQFTVIRRAAVFEQQLKSDEKYNTPQAALKVADYWWDVAERLKDDRQITLVKDHAKEFYHKVDPALLSDVQRGRLDNP